MSESAVPTTIGAFAVAILREQSVRFLDLAPGCRQGTDVRAIHQMRVAARRMRAALRLFRDDLPPAEAHHLTAELKWAAGELGHVRDLDVQKQRLAQIASDLDIVEALQPYRDWMDAERRSAHDAVVVALSSSRFVDLQDALHAVSVWHPLGAGSSRAAAASRLSRTWRAFNKRARRLTADAPTQDFHAARIRAKRVRYAAEFFVPLYGKPAERFSRRVTDVQDILGDIQDGVVGVTRIQAAVGHHGSEWPPETLLGLGRVLAHEYERRQRQKRRFAKTYADVVGRSWRKLAAELDMS